LKQEIFTYEKKSDQHNNSRYCLMAHIYNLLLIQNHKCIFSDITTVFSIH
jgi:hypothetical protein